MTGGTASVALDAAYARCRALHRQHGRSYYLATRLLPAWKRRHVHALYGFTRYTDDIVDGDGRWPERAQRLGDWQDRFYAALDAGAPADDLLLGAVLHTIAVFGLDRGDFDAFFASMRMDLHVRLYPDYGALLEYMEGSAAAIGTMMLPILLAPDEPGGRWTPKEPAAAARAAAREHYRQAAAGISLLPPRSRRCIRLASAVYGGILDAIERRDYDVLSTRAVVPRPQRAAAVARELVRPA